MNRHARDEQDDEGEDEPHFGEPKHRPGQLVDEPHGHKVQGLFNELGHELDHDDHRQKVMARDAMWMELADHDTWGASCSAAR